jgi:hypothetical protein
MLAEEMSQGPNLDRIIHKTINSENSLPPDFIISGSSPI